MTGAALYDRPRADAVVVRNGTEWSALLCSAGNFQSMSEHTGAEPTRVQLHLRVHPELARLIDAYRGPATRNAYAASVLEYELKRRHNDAHDTLTAIADRALMDPDPVRAGWELASGIPAGEVAEAVRGGPQACPHPKARVIKGFCGACGSAA